MMYKINKSKTGKTVTWFREAAKNVIFLVARLKEQYFLPKFATNLSKNNDFVNSVRLSIDMSRLIKKPLK